MWQPTAFRAPVLALDPVQQRRLRSQANVLRPYTRRWAWWIAANIVSWVIVDAAFYLLSQWFDGLDFTRHDGSVVQVYLMLVLSTPLTGRMLLWVLAPSAVISQQSATT